MKKILRFAYLFLCISVILTVNAFAYIDPSAVTYTAQAIAAVVVALGALVTVFRHKIVAFFRKGKGETAKREIHVREEETDAPTEEQE